MESGSYETVVLKVWVQVSISYCLRKLDVVVLSQEILLLGLFNSVSKYVILTRTSIGNSNCNVDFLRERIKILEWVLRPLGADEFFQLPDVILVSLHDRSNIVTLPFLVLIFKIVLSQWILIFVDL